MEQTDNAVMPGNAFVLQEREQLKQFKQLESPDKWFKVYQLPHDVLAISEPYNFQEVFSFLVIGQSGALLIDTGMGIGNIKKVVESLTSLPVSVLNTHSHFDHIGGNHTFATGFIYDTEYSRTRLRRGLPHSEVKGEVEGAASIWLPDGFSAEGYSISPSPNWQFFTGSKTFDLGGRSLTAIYAPGHSPDGVVIEDEQNKILFTGDTFYPAALYAHIMPGGGGLELYAETLKALGEKYGDYTLYCSHNEPLRSGKLLSLSAEALTQVIAGGLPFKQDEQGLKRYDFNEFSIITK